MQLVNTTQHHESNFIKSLIRFILIFTLTALLYCAFVGIFGTNSYLPLVLSIIIGSLVTSWLTLRWPWHGALALSVTYLAYRLSDNSLPSGSLETSVWFITAAYILIQLPTLFTRVPFYPTRSAMIDVIASVLKRRQDDFSFIDLGSGFGGVIYPLARIFPRCKFVGCELAPLPYLHSKIRSFLYPNVIIRYKNFWNEPIDYYDFVYAFLSPEAASNLDKKFFNSSNDQANSSLLVHSFKLDRTETERLHTDEGDLYIYHRL